MLKEKREARNVLRFWSKVSKGEESECWLWLAGTFADDGHGAFWFNGQNITAHRFSFYLRHGYLGDDHIHHKCENKICVNPDHLERLTPYQHMLIGTSRCANQARQTHCKRNHEFNDKNTYVSKRGHRHCRKCHAEKENKRRRSQLLLV